jgi:DNA-binding transcriptional regulator YdaS (Cro superfamily)
VALTPERVKLLAACLVAGRSRTETAEALGVSPRSVSRWKKHPRVLAEVERARSATIEIRALGVLEDLAFHSEDERTRLQAAQTIVRWASQLRS